MSPTLVRPTRRTLVRSAAWSVPVVSLAAAAPAFALTCVARSARVVTSTAATAAPAQGLTRTSNTSASWRTDDPDGAATKYSNARITVSATKASNDILYGFTSGTSNLGPYTTGGVTGMTINQRPASDTVARGYNNRTITNFAFGRPVYDLNFTIADISKQSTNTSTGAISTVVFWDALWIETDGAFSVTNRGSYVIGGGTSSTDPLTPRDTSPNDDDSTNMNVTIQFTGVATYVRVHYWSAQKVTNANDSGGGQGITVSNMSMLLSSDGC